MAKELPYFKFEPAEYLTKDISFCSLSAQGLFINICSYYWQRNCVLTKQQLLKRLNHKIELEELIQEGIIDLTNDTINIKFLDNQLLNVEEKSKTNKVNGSKGGRPKKNPIESETKPKQNRNINPIESETKGIREDKIIIDNINNNINSRKLKFAHSLKPFLNIYSKETIREFCDYWSESNKSNTKFRQELQKTWDTERRLKTWDKNNFNKTSNGKSTITDTNEFKQIITAIKSDGVRR